MSYACLQVEQSAGLFQRVTKGVMDDAFGQLKEVSAAFAQHMRDASRRSCGVQASEQPTAAAAADNDDVSALQQAAAQAEQEGDATTATATAGYSASGGYSQDVFEPEEQQHASAGWSAVLPEDEPHPVLHFQALLQAEQAAAAAAAAANEPSAAEVADVSDSMQFGAAGSNSAQPGTEDISEAIDFEAGGSISAAALLSAVSSEVLPQHADSADMHSRSCRSCRSSIVEALTDAELPTAQGSAASTIGGELGAYSQLAAPASAAAAAAEVVSGSQQYGSSSFESYGDSRSMQQQQQQDRKLLEQQVSKTSCCLVYIWYLQRLLGFSTMRSKSQGTASTMHPCSASHQAGMTRVLQHIYASSLPMLVYTASLHCLTKHLQHQVAFHNSSTIVKPYLTQPTNVLLLPLQLAEAQQQLSALNRHVEAIMVGYAVQALQAGSSKAKAAAIHQQAIKEQQEVRERTMGLLAVS
jgi:hypothetical protein